MAAGIACLLATALLGWLTAYAVGLTGSSAGDATTVEALPSPSPQAHAWAPEFGQTLDLDAGRAGRDTRPSASSPARPPAGTTTRPPAPTPEPAPAPTAAPPSDRTTQQVPIVGQSDPCTSEGATGRTRAGAATVCRATKGNGQLRWRRA